MENKQIKNPKKKKKKKILQVTSSVNTISQGYELDSVGGCFGSDDQRKAV